VPSSAAWSKRPLTVARDPFVPETQSRVPASTIASTAIPLVSAVVTGPAPRALIEDRGRTLVVGVGDFLAGSRVGAVDEKGVHLQNGTLLPLTEDRP
jgi:hypothetical protein